MVSYHAGGHDREGGPPDQELGEACEGRRVQLRQDPPASEMAGRLVHILAAIGSQPRSLHVNAPMGWLNSSMRQRARGSALVNRRALLTGRNLEEEQDMYVFGMHPTGRAAENQRPLCACLVYEQEQPFQAHLRATTRCGHLPLAIKIIPSSGTHLYYSFTCSPPRADSNQYRQASIISLAEFGPQR